MTRTRVLSWLGAAICLAVCVASAQARAGWKCVQTDNGSQNPGAGCGPYRYRGITNSNGDDTYVINDMWNPPGSGHPQTIAVNNAGDWLVTSDQARENTAVLSYPDVQQVFTTTHNAPAPLSGYSMVSSHFAESMPSGGDNEAAYDIWMGRSVSTDYAQEVMIWVDDHRTNPPPGRIVGKPSFDGVPYTVSQDRTDGRRGFHTLYMVRDSNETSGAVDILAMLDWLIQRHLTVATGLNQVDFGWEICSTDGKPKTFRMTAYGIRLRCRAGGNACYAS